MSSYRNLILRSLLIGILLSIGILLFYLRETTSAPVRTMMEERTGIEGGGQVYISTTRYTFDKLVQGDGVIYTALEDGHAISYQRAMEILASQESFDFQDELSEVIVSFAQGVGAVFWECIPININTYSNRPFAFILLPASTLARRSVDPSPFQEQFRQLIPTGHQAPTYPVISFKNLGKDAVLVVPGPANTAARDLQYCTHLSSFLASAASEHRRALWMNVGETFSKTIQGLRDTNDARPIWLSTSGLGVSWLHIRIDLVRAKYYNHVPYKTFLP